MEFDWDSNKAASNLAKHTVDFEMAIKIFLDPCYLEYEQADDVDGVRFNVIGIVDGHMLHVTYALDDEDDVYRIISARPADRHEKRLYHEG